MNINPLNLISISKKNFSFLRVQDGICPFFEKPSNEDEYAAREQVVEITETRITAVDLFSHFTADIIREKVVFIR